MMHSRFLLLFLATLAPTAPAQDLYDTTVLRTIDLAFHDSNWWNLLHQNYASQTLILADLTFEGTVYPDVGVRIRGNTSYFTLPPGAEKVSLSVEMDFVHPDQDLVGYNTLNLNNAHRDPTFCREVVYNNFLTRYIPNGRSNHVLLTLNSQNWGVYANVQQYNADMLREFFDDEDGMRIKCANDPHGPGLQYVGTNPNDYDGYEVKDDGGLADPIGALIDVCYAVTNTPLASWEQIDTLFALDPSIRSVALENLFTDDDSYVNKGADFVTYLDPVDGRMHLLQTDGNECFTDAGWSPTYNFNDSTKPVLSHVLDVPELRQRYMAHLRAALEEFDWAQLEPIIYAHRDLIDAAVQADPKKLYSYQKFLDNFTQTVNLGGGGPGGGSVPGLRPFVNQRKALMDNNSEVSAPAPEILWVDASSDSPSTTDTVYITAEVDGPVVPVAQVELFYLPAPGSYLRTPMLDNGLSGDGAAGDGVYGAVLPITAYPGQMVSYYVGAESANSYGSLSFHPKYTEFQPLELGYTFGTTGMRITEYMYSGSDGEFFELTNLSGAPIDLTGWSYDDQSAVPGTFDLSAAGIVAAGESVIITESTPSAFVTAWGLSGVTVLGSSTAPLGRNDQINVFNDLGEVVDRLTYGDEDFPGSVRARDASASVCSGGLGQEDPYSWFLAYPGDAQNSVASAGGDLGSPGSWSASTECNIGTNYCIGAVNSSGAGAAISATGSTSLQVNNLTLLTASAPASQFGLFFFGPNQIQIAFGDGYRCAGGGIVRISPAQVSTPAGEFSVALDFETMSFLDSIDAGETHNFQCWFRDPPAGGAGFNLSDGLSLTFVP